MCAKYIIVHVYCSTPTINENILEYEKTIRNLPEPEEMVGIFSKKGVLIHEQEGIYIPGIGTVVILPKNVHEKVIGQILTHNHSSDASFSKRDLVEHAYFRFSEMRVVGKSGTFSLSPKESGWPESFEIGEFISQIRSDSEFQSKLNDIQFDPKFCQHSGDINGDMVRIKSHLICEKFSTKCNLNYRASAQTETTEPYIQNWLSYCLQNELE